MDQQERPWDNGQIISVLQAIGQIGQVRYVPVGMVDGKAIVDWNGDGVSIKTKLTRALRQVLNSYLGSEFL